MTASDNLSSGQFDLTPRINNKPNAQGTLFRAAPSQRKPEARQPRGYSPERYRAVAEALDVRFKNRGPGTYGGHEHGGMSLNIYQGHAETLARATAAVARSTVPLSDITRPHPEHGRSEDNPDLQMGVWVGDETHERGHYSGPGTTAQPWAGHIALFHHADDITPIHEIGHHVDRGHPYGTAGDQGRAEGFADAYAATHARTPGYRQRRVGVDSRPQVWHAEPWLEGDYGKQSEFDQAYRTQRAPLHPQQFDFIEDTRRTLGPKTYPPHHVPGQQSLLIKTGTYNPDGTVRDIRWEMPDWARE